MYFGFRTDSFCKFFLFSCKIKQKICLNPVYNAKNETCKKNIAKFNKNSLNATKYTKTELEINVN